MKKPVCGNPEHRGHKRYAGGRMDGDIAHMLYADPSDFPMFFSTTLSGGSRSWYEIDYEASDGTEVVYRWIGDGKVFPLRGTA